MPRINILAISGSIRERSSNLNLINAIADISSDTFTITIFEGLSDIPHFNPDRDNEDAPAEVANFRKQLKAADGILICTPEYAIGVPGVLKDAIDWTVSSMEFSQKPVALITASTSGQAAHKSILGTLLIIESRITDDSQLLISSVRTKVNDENKITDEQTRNSINKLMDSLKAMITHPGSQKYLPAPMLGDPG